MHAYVRVLPGGRVLDGTRHGLRFLQDVYCEQGPISGQTTFEIQEQFEQ